VPRAATFGAASAPWDDFAAGVAAAREARGESVGAAGTGEAGVSETGDTLEELGAELLLGFAVSPAACLHRSDSESLCSLRHGTCQRL
jgi:hypothetical protein